MDEQPTHVIPPQLMVDGRQVVTGVQRGQVAPYIVLAVRDPLGFVDDAATVVARELTDSACVADTGMFRTYTGTYGGVEISVMSTGSGGPEVELAVVELCRTVNSPTIVRVGTSGSAATGCNVGDLVISTAAVRSEGTSRQYVDIEYPAVGSIEVTCALGDAAHVGGYSYALGITRSTDSIYCGQGRDANGYHAPGAHNVAGRWATVGVLNYERETAALFTIGTLLGCRVGSVCSVVNSAVTGELRLHAGVANAIDTALRAFVLLRERDDVKSKLGRATWTPAMG